jgi:hypothetical protein
LFLAFSQWFLRRIALQCIEYLSVAFVFLVAFRYRNNAHVIPGFLRFLVFALFELLRKFEVGLRVLDAPQVQREYELAAI